MAERAEIETPRFPTVPQLYVVTEESRFYTPLDVNVDIFMCRNDFSKWDMKAGVEGQFNAELEGNPQRLSRLPSLNPDGFHIGLNDLRDKRDFAEKMRIYIRAIQREGHKNPFYTDAQAEVDEFETFTGTKTVTIFASALPFEWQKRAIQMVLRREGEELYAEEVEFIYNWEN